MKDGVLTVLQLLRDEAMDASLLSMRGDFKNWFHLERCITVCLKAGLIEVNHREKVGRKKSGKKIWRKRFWSWTVFYRLTDLGKKLLEEIEKYR